MIFKRGETEPGHCGHSHQRSVRVDSVVSGVASSGLKTASDSGKESKHRNGNYHPASVFCVPYATLLIKLDTIFYV